MQTAQLRILFQKTPQRLEDCLCLRPCHQRGQQPHQSPGQQILAKGRPFRHLILAQHGPVGLPDETGRQLQVDGGRNAQPAPVECGTPRIDRHRIGCQRQRKPLRDAVALHQDDFIFQRGQRMGPHPVAEEVAQRLGLVAVNDDETGGDVGLGHADRNGARVFPFTLDALTLASDRSSRGQDETSGATCRSGPKTQAWDSQRSSTALTASGRSIGARWPAPGMMASFAPGTLEEISCARAGGVS